MDDNNTEPKPVELPDPVLEEIRYWSEHPYDPTPTEPEPTDSDKLNELLKQVAELRLEISHLSTQIAVERQYWTSLKKALEG